MFPIMCVCVSVCLSNLINVNIHILSLYFTTYFFRKIVFCSFFHFHKYWSKEYLFMCLSLSAVLLRSFLGLRPIFFFLLSLLSGHPVWGIYTYMRAAWPILNSSEIFICVRGFYFLNLFDRKLRLKIFITG